MQFIRPRWCSALDLGSRKSACSGPKSCCHGWPGQIHISGERIPDLGTSFVPRMARERQDPSVLRAETAGRRLSGPGR